VLLILLYFIAHSSKEKQRAGVLLGFSVFSWAFLKKLVFFIGSNYINTEDNYGRLIEFLSQISKLS